MFGLKWCGWCKWYQSTNPEVREFCVQLNRCFVCILQRSLYGGVYVFTSTFICSEFCQDVASVSSVVVVVVCALFYCCHVGAVCLCPACIVHRGLHCG